MTTKKRSDLDTLCERLRQRAVRSRWREYRVPAVWNCWNYGDARRVGRREIAVNPYRFLLDVLERYILPTRGTAVVAGARRRRAGNWIRAASIYGLFVRATTAWDHDGDGDLSSPRCTETGTFVKSILLLPRLGRMGVNVLYLLPVTKHSNLYRKGELGCPYSAKNFFALEPSLHDRLLGDDVGDVEMEFGALVEAAHAMGMRVILDLAPRTAARDSDLILDHPDWFYWIDRKAERGYGAPRIEGVEYDIPRPSDLPDIHRRANVREHLAKFRFAPNVTTPAKWARFARRMRAKRPRNLLAEIGREFGVITPPGFSDCVNDPQPPWSDVTFLRLFRDHPAAAVRCLPDPENQPPYVFSEVIKASRFPGNKPNTELWKMLAGILPFYQRFGVDGARIDMGHALPTGLERMILDAPRRIDPGFCFIAEEFGTETSAKARRAGYNMLIGPSWYMQPRAAEGLFHDMVQRVLPASKLPIWATPETPDSPRAVVRRGGRRFVRLAAVVNHFLPNAVPFVNSGMELYERQPMNLGLDASPPGRYALQKSDPYYGKLAFFDRYVLHWGNTGAAPFAKLLARVADVRSRFADDLANPANHFAPTVTMNRKAVLAVGFHVERRSRVLLVVANTDYRNPKRAVVTHLPRADRVPGPDQRRRAPQTRPPRAEVLFEVGGLQAPLRIRAGKVIVNLPPGGALGLLLV